MNRLSSRQAAELAPLERAERSFQLFRLHTEAAEAPRLCHGYRSLRRNTHTAAVIEAAVSAPNTITTRSVAHTVVVPRKVCGN